MVRNRILNDIEWDSFLKMNLNSSVFQTPGWAQYMMKSHKNYKALPFCFDFTDGTQILWSVLQQPYRKLFYRLEAMPFGLYGRPIINGIWSPEKGKEILHSILSGRNIELTYSEYPFSESIDFELPVGVIQKVKSVSTHILCLTETWDEMFEVKFSSRIRNQVRRAKKEGLEVRTGVSAEDIDNFYDLYKISTKKWGYKEPPYTKHFFSSIINCRLDFFKLLLVVDKGSIIAGGIFIEDSDSVLYWFSAMDESVEKKFPMYLLLSYAINEAITKRKKYFNMGASGENEGVRRFKELWGATPIIYNQYIFKRDRVHKQIDRISKVFNVIRN